VENMPADGTGYKTPVKIDGRVKYIRPILQLTENTIIGF
jgi:hypothetical protein